MNSAYHRLYRTLGINIAYYRNMKDMSQEQLGDRLEIDPDIRWSRTGRIQLNEEVTVTLTMDMDIGFGGLGSFPIELTAQASGRSEVYWK